MTIKTAKIPEYAFPIENGDAARHADYVPSTWLSPLTRASVFSSRMFAMLSRRTGQHLLRWEDTPDAIPTVIGDTRWGAKEWDDATEALMKEYRRRKKSKASTAYEMWTVEVDVTPTDFAVFDVC